MSKVIKKRKEHLFYYAGLITMMNILLTMMDFICPPELFLPLSSFQIFSFF